MRTHGTGENARFDITEVRTAEINMVFDDPAKAVRQRKHIDIGADFGVGNSIFRFSGSFFDQDGVVPNNAYKRYTLRLSNTTRFGKLLDITPSVTYIKTNNNKVLRSAGGFMLSLLSWPTTNDIRNAGDNATKTPLFANALANSEIDNPLFSVNNNKSYETTDKTCSKKYVNFFHCKNLFK